MKVKHDFIKILKTNRQNKIDEIKADLFWFIVLTCTIFSLLWFLSGEIK